MRRTCDAGLHPEGERLGLEMKPESKEKGQIDGAGLLREKRNEDVEGPFRSKVGFHGLSDVCARPCGESLDIICFTVSFDLEFLL